MRSNTRSYELERIKVYEMRYEIVKLCELNQSKFIKLNIMKFNLIEIYFLNFLLRSLRVGTVLRRVPSICNSLHVRDSAETRPDFVVVGPSSAQNMDPSLANVRKMLRLAYILVISARSRHGFYWVVKRQLFRLVE